MGRPTNNEAGAAAKLTCGQLTAGRGFVATSRKPMKHRENC
jgi:hypothetical protein